MADPIYFAPLRVKLVDQRTGLMAREWYLFFQALWLRTGGVEAPSIDDLLQNSAEGLDSADLHALQIAGDQALAQLPDNGNLQALQLAAIKDVSQQPTVVVIPFDELLCQQLTGVKDQMAEMAKQLQDIKLAVNTGN